MTATKYWRGKPPPDRRTDILYRIASKKVGSSIKLMSLFQKKLAAELGTSRQTLNAIFEQYEGVDLGEVFDKRFSGIKLFKAPTVWMLDDDKGELLSHFSEGEFMGLCTDCGTWAWIPRPFPSFVTCDGCGTVYFEASDSHGEVNLSSCQSLNETHTRDFPECIRLILKGGPKYVPFKRGPFPSYVNMPNEGGPFPDSPYKYSNEHESLPEPSSTGTSPRRGEWIPGLIFLFLILDAILPQKGRRSNG